jgi:PRTRC genetic system protein B
MSCFAVIYDFSWAQRYIFFLITQKISKTFFTQINLIILLMKNENVNNLVRQQQVPCMALIVYRNDQTGNLYLESHRIDEKGRMLAGRPLTLRCITELADAFAVESGGVPHGILPANMLFCDTRKGHERYVWYNPPRKRMMFFNSKLNMDDGEYAMPGLIYDTCGERLDIYAFSEEKPIPDSVLYKAPMFNMTEESVCMGNAKINFPDNPTFPEYINCWEKKFWQTEFSHLGNCGNPTRNNLVIVIKNSTKYFDYEELIPLKKKEKTQTLTDLLK